MKRLLSIAFTMGCLLAACSKDKTAALPAETGGPRIDTTAQVQTFGSFMPTSGITVSGSAKVISVAGRYQVLLDSFMVSQGPDLKVYLSKENTPVGFINLGALKSNNGNSAYDIPPGVDLQLYPYVLIHCQQYNHLFAIAQLKP